MNAKETTWSFGKTPFIDQLLVGTVKTILVALTGRQAARVLTGQGRPICKHCESSRAGTWSRRSNELRRCVRIISLVCVKTQLWNTCALPTINNASVGREQNDQTDVRRYGRSHSSTSQTSERWLVGGAGVDWLERWLVRIYEWNGFRAKGDLQPIVLRVVLAERWGLRRCNFRGSTCRWIGCFSGANLWFQWKILDCPFKTHFVMEGHNSFHLDIV